MDVAVLAGGRSPEHEVSLASAAQVLQHLDRLRWRVWPVYLDRDGGFWPARAPLPAGATWRPREPGASCGPLRPGAAIDWLLDHARVEVVFPVLHGPLGEDGTVQGMLELYDLPCVGSGCAASAVAMDKLRTRQALAAAGVPLAQAYEPRTPLRCAEAREEFPRLVAAVGLPAFVKVDASGSTVGVQRVATEQELASFFAAFRTGFRRWFGERQLDGEEITVAVPGNTGDELLALPPIGIYPQCDPFFTHEAKYTKGAAEEVIPPRGLSPAQIELVMALAIRCHEALVCDGMSRTDMIVTDDGPVVLETNTIPGMTGTSLLPQAAAAAGIPFPALLDRLLLAALDRRGALPAAGPPASHARQDAREDRAAATG
ncbi:MAG: D-alanine--D-alanine ligase [Planctomycetes bacterium]|nr:D-alanine--D-alanine ligase [Planctomycetota bacterium]